MIVARCSCGTTFVGPATTMLVAIMVGHWRHGHSLIAAGRMAYDDIAVAAHDLAREFRRTVPASAYGDSREVEVDDVEFAFGHARRGA